ncbi:uncharacterized protein LOC116028865 isoform X2 [Ipomoea triloba]|uniref:uncharacterized protein LOC116028865 isoform X2 n=1 Tax=Ipomoea triloba TaxID=35885 RepID=UPI00125E259E|nr:uncharacterized protein LOC116028865 isoform X2 [Ipomoea triloba]
MAESSAFSLLGVMDCLWFYQSIFSAESPSVLCPKPLESLQYSPVQNLIPGNYSSSTVDEITPQDEDEEEESRQNETTEKERLTRLDLAACKSRSHSFSPSLDRICKSLGELELEEVKGFMDLGFIFDKEQTSKKMMSVLPGLQRLQLINEIKDKDDMESGRVRPYLSEAWLIKSPNSPLLNLRMPRASAAVDMKRHLKHWAKTVATVIHQES